MATSDLILLDFSSFNVLNLLTKLNDGFPCATLAQAGLASST